MARSGWGLHVPHSSRSTQQKPHSGFETMPSDAITARLATVPDLPGAYLIKDAAETVIYVGKARSLRKRLRQHFRENAPRYGWTQQLYAHAQDVDYVVTGSELEAFILEAALIKEYNPRYNIRLTDDKSYPYLKLTDELYPRLMVLRDLPKDARVSMSGPSGGRRYHDPRRHEVHGSSRGRIFGPYPDATSMRRTMRLVPRLFGLRSCNRKLDGAPQGKPCLNLHIGRCLGPCRGAEVVPPEEYEQAARQTARLLQGKSGEVLQDLEARMKAAAEAQEFERAARLRDALRAVERVTQEQVVVAVAGRDQDVVAVAQEGDRALVALLQVRAGRLVRQDQFAFEHTTGRAPEEVVEAFLTQHYARATQVPPEVLVTHEPPDPEAWMTLLAEARGGPVRLYRPQRGEKRRLVELALKNAQVGLRALEQTRTARAQTTRAALGDLADALDLPAPPRRVECFDISTTQGRDSTGAQVVFTDGLPDKRAYRRYRMRATEGKPDDYAMMAEMLRRRMGRALGGDPKFLPLPDLVVVDGGKGQLSTALEVLREAGLEEVPVVGLAKQEEEVFVPGESAPVDMTAHQPARLLLQRLRDEAHRFAITHHRGVRGKHITASALDDVPGIGPARKRTLLATFGSARGVAEASVEELAQVKGMTRAAAEALLRHLTEEDVAGE